MSQQTLNSAIANSAEATQATLEQVTTPPPEKEGPSPLYGFNLVVLVIGFLLLVRWAWSGKRKADFAKYAAMPLEDEPPTHRKNQQQ